MRDIAEFQSRPTTSTNRSVGLLDRGLRHRLAEQIAQAALGQADAEVVVGFFGGAAFVGTCLGPIPALRKGAFFGSAAARAESVETGQSPMRTCGSVD